MTLAVESGIFLFCALCHCCNYCVRNYCCSYSRDEMMMRCDASCQGENGVFKLSVKILNKCLHVGDAEHIIFFRAKRFFFQSLSFFFSCTCTFCQITAHNTIHTHAISLMYSISVKKIFFFTLDNSEMNTIEDINTCQQKKWFFCENNKNVHDLFRYERVSEEDNYFVMVFESSSTQTKIHVHSKSR